MVVLMKACVMLAIQTTRALQQLRGRGPDVRCGGGNLARDAALHLDDVFRAADDNEDGEIV